MPTEEEKDPQALVADEWFQEQTAEMDDDADTALSEWEELLASSELKEFPDEVIAEFKKDGERLESARDDFNTECNKATGGNGNIAKLLDAYDRFSLTLGALQANNERVAALQEAKIGAMAAAVTSLGLLMLKNGKKKVEELEKQLAALEKDLEKAEKAVKAAKLQGNILKVIKAGTFAVTTALGPTALVARGLVTAGSVTSQIIVDYALGPDRGSAGNNAATVLGGVASNIDKLGLSGKLLSAAGVGIINYKKGADETATAVQAAAALKAKFQKTLNLYEEVMGILVPLSLKAKSLQDGLERSLKAVADAPQKSADAGKHYDAIRKHLAG